MAGVSYGGLTACYAAAAQPEYFRRVFCQSPSVYWNFGELARVVTANAATTRNRPLAVVVYIGTVEMASPLCSDVSCSSTTSWFTFVNGMVEAFRMAGGADLHFFTVAGAQHDATAWTTTFAAGVTEMFAANFSTPFQMQYSETSAINVVYPMLPSTTTSASNRRIATWWLLVGLLVLQSAAVATCWLRRRKKKHVVAYASVAVDDD